VLRILEIFPGKRHLIAVVEWKVRETAPIMLNSDFEGAESIKAECGVGYKPLNGFESLEYCYKNYPKELLAFYKT